MRINFVLNDRLGVGAKLNEIIIDRFDSSLILDLPKNRNFSLVKSMFVPATKEITQPYWLQNKMQEGYFNVTNQQMIGRADIQPAYEVTYKLTIGGEQFSFVKPLRYKFSDQVKGEIYWPVVVLPGFEIEQMNDVVKATDDNIFQIDFRVVSNTRHSTLPFTVQVLPSGFNSSIKDVLPQSNSRGSIKEFSKTDNKLFDSWQKSLNTHWLNANKNEEN